MEVGCIMVSIVQVKSPVHRGEVTCCSSQGYCRVSGLTLLRLGGCPVEGDTQLFLTCLWVHHGQSDKGLQMSALWIVGLCHYLNPFSFFFFWTYPLFAREPEPLVGHGIPPPSLETCCDCWQNWGVCISQFEWMYQSPLFKEMKNPSLWSIYSLRNYQNVSSKSVVGTTLSTKRERWTWWVGPSLLEFIV